MGIRDHVPRLHVRRSAASPGIIGIRARTFVLRVLVYALILVFGCLILAPFFWMISSSLKEDWEIFVYPPTLIPQTIKWANYPEAIATFPLARATRNTLIITIGVMFGRLLTASAVAFGFARLRFRGREPLFALVLATLMLPYQVTLIPTYLLFRELGWLDSFLPLIVPAYFGGGAFNIFLLRQFFLSIPVEMSDAAKIDGCSTAGIFGRIILPMSKEALGAVAIFTFVGEWNDFLAPLIYLNEPSKHTISIALEFFKSNRTSYEQTITWGHLMVISLLTMLPCLIVFFFAQRYFIQGIVVSGVKG